VRIKVAEHKDRAKVLIAPDLSKKVKKARGSDRVGCTMGRKISES
jgi:hypothetical protein